MSCKRNKTKQNCGTVIYGVCTRYEGEVSENSNLTAGCLNIEETTQDIYEQLDKLEDRIILESVGTGAEVYKGIDNTGKKEIRSLKSSDGSVIITQNTDDIDFTVPPQTPDGSETKLENGINTTVVGTGTIEDPYKVNTTSATYSAGTGLSLSGTVFNNTAPDKVVSIVGGGTTSVTGTYPNFTVTTPTPNGSETKIVAGTNITVAGTGTVGTPYIISASSGTAADGSETKITAGTNTTVTGTGTVSSPYIINSSGGRPYKVYSILISQTGTNAPTTVVLQNEIGNIVWTRAGAGSYLGTLTGAFPINKVFSFVANRYTNSEGTIFRFDNDRMVLTTTNNVSDTDGLLTNTSLEIRVYN